MSWNLRSLALNDRLIQGRKKGVVGLLANKHHIVCLLEARGTLPIIQKWMRSWRTSHLLFYSVNAADEATTGIVFMIQKVFLAKFFITPAFNEVIGGRAVSVLLSSPLGAPAYVMAIHSERFSRNMIGFVADERRRLNEATASASPRPGFGILHGDFNFCGLNGVRWEGRSEGICVVPHKQSDKWNQRRYEGASSALIDFLRLRKLT